MILIHLALAACLLATDESAAGDGEICGLVVNLSEDEAPAPGIEVILRVRLDGEFVAVAAVQSDREGRFAFAELPVEEDLVYLPGANLDGIHYPGPRLRLDRHHPTAMVKLAVRETINAPNPLVIRRHEIVIQAEAGALHVTEALLVDNPTQRTFVGRGGSDEQPPVTFVLGIPLDFERLTFEQEFFGRNFAMVDGRLATSIPWEPGPRWLRFTATVRNEQSVRRWQRRLDGPCEDLRVRVRQENHDQVRCNLAELLTDTAEERVFSSGGKTLAADHILEVELGALPLPWMSYARWLALLLLAGSIAGVGIALRTRPTQDQADVSPGTTAAGCSSQRRGKRPRVRPSSSPARMP
ncbi:MAG: hypothetical protein KJ000_08855 [Pirellulaceae bacterium]|nr:hypothetical protein [Pirellulaceae bacterium]